jgi:ACT domain-containing protein
LRAAGYDIKPSKCLGVCIGPVVAAPIKNRVHIISEVKGAETIHDLTLAISQGKMRSLRQRKVTGSKRDKARRKALQAAQR